ncbi:MAG: zf-HC2 domain-containing protein [Pyrinomonadaceae bacterium]
MNCKELKAMMESYISDELLIETNHDVLRHLENCADCRNEMSSRRALKTQLKHAVIAESDSAIDPFFRSRLTAELKETAFRPNFIEKIGLRSLAVGLACLVLAFAGTLVWMNRGLFTSNTDIAGAVRASWAELTTLAVGDHENCAVSFHLKEAPISLDEAASKFGAYNKDLDKAVMSALKSSPDLSNDVQFLEAHSCIYDGRRFAHVVVKQKGKVVSLLLTDTDLPAEDDLVKTALYDGAVRAAGFLAGHHAVFVVSQLADNENVAIANAVAPAIRTHIEKPVASIRRIDIR